MGKSKLIVWPRAYSGCFTVSWSFSLRIEWISHSKDPNWERKERLLRFDREFARRTEIIDDQGDYQGPSTWMNDEERANAEENQEKQQDALKRPKQVLNLAL